MNYNVCTCLKNVDLLINHKINIILLANCLNNVNSYANSRKIVDT